MGRHLIFISLGDRGGSAGENKREELTSIERGDMSPERDQKSVGRERLTSFQITVKAHKDGPVAIQDPRITEDHTEAILHQDSWSEGGGAGRGDIRGADEVVQRNFCCSHSLGRPESRDSDSSHLSK
jgi:hypothetical protein